MLNRIIIYPTDSCNLNCKYCFVKKNKNLFLKWDKNFENIVDILWESNEKYKEIEFLWWEPLLNFNFIQNIIEYSKKFNNINFVIYTNWILLNKKIITFFIKNRIKINLSIDWNKKNHEKERIWIKDSHEIILKNLKQYVKLNKWKYPLWKLTVNPSNIEWLFDNIIYLIKSWFKEIYFDIAKWENWNKKEYEIFKIIFDKIYKIQEKLWKLVNILNVTEIIENYNNNTLNKLWWCRLWESITIWYDNNIYSCQTAIELDEKNKKKFFISNINNFKKDYFKKIEEFKWWEYSDEYYKSNLTKISWFDKRLCLTYTYHKKISKKNIDYRIKIEEFMLKYILEKI